MNIEKTTPMIKSLLEKNLVLVIMLRHHIATLLQFNHHY